MIRRETWRLTSVTSSSTFLRRPMLQTLVPKRAAGQYRLCKLHISLPNSISKDYIGETLGLTSVAGAATWLFSPLYRNLVPVHVDGQHGLSGHQISLSKSFLMKERGEIMADLGVYGRIKRFHLTHSGAEF